MISSTVWKENPYIIGRPIYEPELFFGREELFNFITDNLSQRAKVILLHGQRRIGKSSVLCQIPNFVHLEDFVFVPFDLQDQTRLPLSRALHNLATEITNRLNLTQGRVTPPTPAELENNQDIFADKFLPQIYEALGDKNLVLLLDEFDVLSDYSGDVAVEPKDEVVGERSEPKAAPFRRDACRKGVGERSEHFFPYLQSIIYRQEKLFIIPVVGRRLDDMPTLLSLFKGAPNQEIGLLDERSAKRMITEPARGVFASLSGYFVNRLEYSSDAIQAIFELSSGHPYFTQLLCHVLFARGARDEQRSTITPTDVESIVDKAIESGEAGLAWFRDGLPIPERVVFSAVAELQEKGLPPGGQAWGGYLEPGSVMFEPQILLSEYGVVLTEPLRKAEERLVEWGFLREVGSSDQIFKAATYNVTVGLVRRWLVKRHLLRREIWQLERLDAEAHRTYEKASEMRQSGDFWNALKLYEQVLETNPNHFSALFEMAEVCLDVEEFGKAEELYRRAYKVDPIRNEEGFVRALLSYGRDLMFLGKFEQAKQKFTRALELNPDNVLVRKRLEEVEAGIRRALAVRNPFIVGRPVSPDEFVGREREIQTILSLIEKGIRVATVCGERGMGKTSLLRNIASPEVWRAHGLDPSQALIIYLDCEASTSFTITDLWQHVSLELERQMEGDTEVSSLIAELQSIKDWDPRELLRALGKRKRFLVMLLDEFDVILQPHDTYSEDIFGLLVEKHSLTVHNPDECSVSFMVTTRLRINDLELLRKYPPDLPLLFLLLKPFDENEIQALLAKMPEEFALSNAEIAWVRQVAGGYPYLLQAALSILFQLHADNKPFDVKHSTQELATTCESFFSMLWDGASKEEQMLLTLIALSNFKVRTGKQLYDYSNYEVIFSEYERELRNLEDRGLFIRGGRENEYHYALISSLMEWWIIGEIEARRESELKKQAKIFSDFLEPDLAEQLRNALQQVWKNKVAFDAIEAWGQPLKRR